MKWQKHSTIFVCLFVLRSRGFLTSAIQTWTDLEKVSKKSLYQFWPINIYIYCSFCINTSPCSVIRLFPLCHTNTQIAKTTALKLYAHCHSVLRVPLEPQQRRSERSKPTIPTVFTFFSFSPTSPSRAFSLNILSWPTLNSCNDSFTHTASVLFVNYSAPGINSEALSLWVCCRVMLLLSVSPLNTANADKTGVRAAPRRALSIALLNDSCSPLSALMQPTEWAVYQHRLALQTTAVLWSHASPLESGPSRDLKRSSEYLWRPKSSENVPPGQKPASV